MGAETCSDEEYKPRYQWRETWSGESKQDFSGYDAEELFGRI
jgi:hypothetical protein